MNDRQPRAVGRSDGSPVSVLSDRPINPFLPLQGRRVLVTRARAQAGALCDLLAAAGAVPVLLPAIAVRPVGDLGPLDRALERLWMGGWLAFTSANAVHVVLDHVGTRADGAAALPAGARIAAVGPATARALEGRGVRVDAMPPDAVGAALAGALGDAIGGKLVVLPGSDIARDETADALRAAGALVERVVVYATGAASLDQRGRAELERGVDAVTFTSPSTVRGLMEQLEPRMKQKVAQVAVACIGPTTAAAAREAGLTVTVSPTEHTAQALVGALDDYFRNRGPLAPDAASGSTHQAAL